MGSIELNVKNADTWQEGRNARYVRDIDNRMADSDIRAIADRAIKDARPTVGERLREGAGQIGERAGRLVENFRRHEEEKREAWEIFRDKISQHYLVVRESDNRIGLYEPAGKTPAITIDKNRISTSAESGVAITDSVKLAVTRGWTSLKVDGTAAYKDAVWLEAKKYDLKVAHKPSPLVRAEFERWRENNDLKPLPDRSDAPLARKTQTPASPAAEPKRDLGAQFLKMSAEQRLADPQLRNAELSARAARERAAQRFGADDPKLKVAIASVDKLVSDQLRRGHNFSTPKIVPQPVRAPKPEKQKFDRPRL